MWHEFSALASLTNGDVILAGRRGWHRSARQKVKESAVTGTTYLRRLPQPVERLPDEVCRRDKAGNRPSHLIRVVEVQTTPHFERGKYRPLCQ